MPLFAPQFGGTRSCFYYVLLVALLRFLKKFVGLLALNSTHCSARREFVLSRHLRNHHSPINRSTFLQKLRSRQRRLACACTAGLGRVGIITAEAALAATLTSRGPGADHDLPPP